MRHSLITRTYLVFLAAFSYLVTEYYWFLSSLILPSTANFLLSLSSTSLLKSCSIDLFYICWVLTEFIFFLLRSVIAFSLTYSPTVNGCADPALTEKVLFVTHSFIPALCRVWAWCMVDTIQTLTCWELSLGSIHIITQVADTSFPF